MTIKQELMDAAKVKAKVGEKAQDLLKRVQVAVDKLSEDVWDKLSGEAQNWQNVATKALDAGKDLPAFDAEPAPTTKKKKVVEEKAPAKKVVATKVTGGGIKERIKKLLIKKPNLSVDQIIETLQKDGEKLSRATAAGMRSEFRHTVRVMQANNCDVMKIDLG